MLAVIGGELRHVIAIFYDHELGITVPSSDLQGHFSRPHCTESHGHLLQRCAQEGLGANWTSVPSQISHAV